MYHPNFDIKGLIINSLKLSQNQNIYISSKISTEFLSWRNQLMFLKILDSHNHLLLQSS